MRRAVHLDDALLVRLAEGARATSRVERHLAACAACRRRLETTSSVLEVLGRKAPPPRLVEAAAALLGRRRPVEPVPASLVRHHHPGAAVEAPAGLRSAAPATEQWLFQAGTLAIEVQSFPEGPDALRLHGQVFEAGRGRTDLPVHLSHGGPPTMAVTDALGEFSLGPAHGRRVSLLVETDGGVHRLDLGPLGAGEERR